MTKISVVMSVYNGGATLAATLESILAQTLRDFEAIVVNDGSTDDTARVLAAYAERDLRIRVIEQENAGLTRALIRGCGAARGEYIARHDAGDLSHPRRFEKQAGLLDADPRLAFVACWTAFVGPEQEPMYVTRGTGVASAAPAHIIDVDARHGTVDAPTSHPAVMFRRDAYERAGGYRAAFYYAQDWDLWYRLAEQGMFQIVPEVLYEVRFTPGAISSFARKMQVDLLALSMAAMRARRNGESDEAIVARAAEIGRATGTMRRAPGLYFIGEALRRNGDARARKYFQAAIAESPLYFRAWVRLFQSLILRAGTRHR